MQTLRAGRVPDGDVVLRESVLHGLALAHLVRHEDGQCPVVLLRLDHLRDRCDQFLRLLGRGTGTAVAGVLLAIGQHEGQKAVVTVELRGLGELPLRGESGREQCRHATDPVELLQRRHPQNVLVVNDALHLVREHIHRDTSLLIQLPRTAGQIGDLLISHLNHLATQARHRRTRIQYKSHVIDVILIPGHENSPLIPTRYPYRLIQH